MILRILFLTFSNANVQFADKEFIWISYTTKKTLSTTCWIEFINKKKFAKVVLDENVKVFVVNMVLLTLKITIYLA